MSLKDCRSYSIMVIAVDFMYKKGNIRVDWRQELLEITVYYIKFILFRTHCTRRLPSQSFFIKSGMRGVPAAAVVDERMKKLIFSYFLYFFRVEFIFSKFKRLEASKLLYKKLAEGGEFVYKL